MSSTIGSGDFKNGAERIVKTTEKIKNTLNIQQLPQYTGKVEPSGADRYHPNTSPIFQGGPIQFGQGLRKPVEDIEKSITNNRTLQALIDNLEKENFDLKRNLDLIKHTEDKLIQRIQILEENNVEKHDSKTEQNFLKHKLEKRSLDVESLKKSLKDTTDKEIESVKKFQELEKSYKQKEIDLKECQMKLSRKNMELKGLTEQNDILRKENRRLVQSENQLRQSLMEISISNQKIKEKKIAAKKEEIDDVVEDAEVRNQNTTPKKQIVESAAVLLPEESKFDSGIRMNLLDLVEEEINKVKLKQSESKTQSQQNSNSRIFPSIYHLDAVLMTLSSLKPLLSHQLPQQHTGLIQTLVHGALGCSSTVLTMMEESKQIEMRISQIGVESVHVREETEYTIKEMYQRYEAQLDLKKEENKKLESTNLVLIEQLKNFREKFIDLEKRFLENEKNNVASTQKETSWLLKESESEVSDKKSKSGGSNAEDGINDHLPLTENNKFIKNFKCFRMEYENVTLLNGNLRKELEAINLKLENFKVKNTKLKNFLVELGFEEFDELGFEQESALNFIALNKNSKLKSFKNFDQDKYDKLKLKLEKTESNFEDEKLRNFKAAELIKLLKSQLEKCKTELEKFKIKNLKVEGNRDFNEQNYEEGRNQLDSLEKLVDSRLEKLKVNLEGDRKTNGVNDIFEIGEVENLLVLLKENQDTNAKLKCLSDMIEEQSELLRSVKDEKENLKKSLKMTKDSLSEKEKSFKEKEDEFRRILKENDLKFEGVIKEYKEKFTARDQSWLNKFKLLKSDLNYNSEDNKKLKSVLEQYELTFKEVKALSLSKINEEEQFDNEFLAIYNSEILNEEAVGSQLNFFTSLKNLRQLLSENKMNNNSTQHLKHSMQQNFEHPFNFSAIIKFLLEQNFGLKIKIKNIFKSNLDLKKSLNIKLMEVENLNDNIKNKMEFEFELKSELEKFKLKNEESGNHLEMCLNEKKLIESKLKRIVGGFKMIVGE
ncbi:hypothetical protein HK099_001938 [Clydaea vesicula]|uniref:Uncharacterized protein n=1 Tax=Clydaea vesicula TaxID=447962 RepID=A0AAD5U320_9FUNG|nr:hypothetical protein HK099_001938 [Clydaea vesicula]